jgi:ribosomal protein S18 acetylase RimI-like enzyme
VNPRFLGQKIATLLMAACFHLAMERHDVHAMLHVAGGLQNVPAVRLYRKFGFVPVSEEVQSAPENLFVLSDIRQSLEHIDWQNLLESAAPPRKH